MALTLGAWLWSPLSWAGDVSLSQKEVADLAKPSVVRIVEKVKGKATVPEIQVDFKTMTVELKKVDGKEAPPYELQVDDYFSGSGVIVHPDGYILTNSHVISYQSIKNLIVADFIYSALEEGALVLNEEEIQQYVSSRSEEEIEEFAEKVSDFILERSQFELEKNIVVLNPALKKEKFEDLVAKSFPAQVISVNDNFYKDDRDAALIKIDQTGLPALSLGDSNSVSVGKKVYIYGYPSTATINTSDNLEPTFTQGTLSATKDSKKKDFKIFQTDAKISRGSSGGPLLDESGKIIGLVTFITAETFKEEGDSFAFALPIDLSVNSVKNFILPEKSIPEFTSGKYESGFLEGLTFFRENQCSKAIEAFGRTKDSINENFLSEERVGDYIGQCNEKIKKGQSNDSSLSIWVSKFRAIDQTTKWIVATSLAVLIILAIAWLWLFRKVKRDEKELDNVEEFLHLNLEDGKPTKNSEENSEEKNTNIALEEKSEDKKDFLDQFKP